MSKRTISINPQFFNISKKKKKIVPSEVNINASNIRQMLLDKLKEHKRTRKIETKITPLLQDKTFDESCKDITETTETTETKDEVKIHSTKNDNELIEPIQSKSYSQSVELNKSHKDKPYGNLKNGIKPTFKQMYQEIEQSQEKEIDEIEEKDSHGHIDQSKTVLEEKEVKKTFKLGKSGKKISILIKNNKTRKKIEDKKTQHKNEKISTIKNYLKEKNLIKFGTSAPSKLLREMYETSEMCGGIVNHNKDVLIHNFDK
jgi:hypothetical protein